MTAALTADGVRPLTDQVTVQSAGIVNFAVSATLSFLSGPDSAVVLTSAQARLDAHLAEIRRLGRDVTRAGIIAALHAPGVQNVVLTAPAADLALTRAEVSRLRSELTAVRCAVECIVEGPPSTRARSQHVS